MIQILMLAILMTPPPQASGTVSVGDWLVGAQGGKCSAVRFYEREADGRVNVQGRALLYTLDGEERSITFQDPSWRFEPGARPNYVLRFDGSNQEFETQGAVARAGNSITTVWGSHDGRVRGATGSTVDGGFAASTALVLQYEGETLGSFEASGAAEVMAALRRCAAGQAAS